MCWQWAGPKLHSLLSAHRLIGAYYFLTTERDECMRLLIRHYGIYNIILNKKNHSTFTHHTYSSSFKSYTPVSTHKFSFFVDVTLLWNLLPLYVVLILIVPVCLISYH